MADPDLTQPRRLLRRSHFWEVHLRGNVVVTRHGKGVGLSGGRETTRQFNDAAEASQWALDAFASKMADGYLPPEQFNKLRAADAHHASDQQPRHAAPNAEQSDKPETPEQRQSTQPPKPPDEPMRSEQLNAPPKQQQSVQPTQSPDTKSLKQSELLEAPKLEGPPNSGDQSKRTEPLTQNESPKPSEQPKPTEQQKPTEQPKSSAKSTPSQPLKRKEQPQSSAPPKPTDPRKVNEQSKPNGHSKHRDQLNTSENAKPGQQPKQCEKPTSAKLPQQPDKQTAAEQTVKPTQAKPPELSGQTQKVEKSATSKEPAPSTRPEQNQIHVQNQKLKTSPAVRPAQANEEKGSPRMQHTPGTTTIRRSGRKRTAPAPYIAESASRPRPRRRVSDSGVLTDPSSPIPHSSPSSLPDEEIELKVTEQPPVQSIDSPGTPPSTPMTATRGNSRTRQRKRGSKRGGRGRSQTGGKSPPVKRHKRTARTFPPLPENVPLGVVDQSSGVDNGVIYTEDSNSGETVVFDVLLVYIEKHTHTDKFIVLQLIRDPSSESPYVLFEKIGRTGSAGQSLRIDFATSGLQEAREEFVRRFQDYTGLPWTNRHAAPMPGKYRFAKQDYELKFRVLFLTDPHWQYWVDEGDNRKSRKWLDYNEEDSMLAEELQMEFSSNPWLSERIVQNGSHFDLVNLESMTTTEVGHPNSSVHHFRRATVNEKPKSRHANNEKQPSTVVCANQATSIKSTREGVVGRSKSISLVPQFSQGSLAQTQTPTAASVLSNRTESGSELPAVAKVPSVASGPMSMFCIPQMAQSAVMSQALMPSGSMLPQAAPQAPPLHPLMQALPDVSGPIRLAVSAPISRFGIQTHAHNGSIPTGIHPSLAPTGVVGALESGVLQLDNHTKLTGGTEPLLMSLAMQQQGLNFLQSALPIPTKALIELLFNSETHRSSLKRFGIDLRLLPLNHLTAKQVQQGVTVLEQIEAALTQGTNVSRTELERLSTKFYTVLPHRFENRRPPVILSMELLQRCYDMCITLFHMVQALSILTTARTKIGAMGEPKILPSLLYGLLNVEMNVVIPGSEEHLIISEAFHQTKGAFTTSELLNIWRVERQGDVERFSRMNLVNHALLWSGCHIGSVPSILTNGLQILGHSGGRLGKGIYCASESGKSLQSTVPDARNQIGCMVLVEAALGRSYEVFEDQHLLLAPPHGFNSLRACGRRAPAGYKNVRLDNVQVSIAVMGAQPQMNAAQSCFSQDEFVVYDEAQVRLRYLVTVKKK